MGSPRTLKRIQSEYAPGLAYVAAPLLPEALFRVGETVVFSGRPPSDYAQGRSFPLGPRSHELSGEPASS